MAFPATAVGEVRTTGSDLNGGYFNSARGGTDYSMQDAAQATGTVTSVTTTVTATTAIFTSAMVGNYITDGTTWREITAFTSTTVVTVDSAPSWSGASIKVGGALLTLAAAIALMTVNGITVWVKSGTYTVGTGITFPSGPTFTALNFVQGYTSTRGDRSTRPVIQASAAITLFTLGQNGLALINLDLDGNSTGNNGVLVTAAYCNVYECKFRRFLNYGYKSNINLVTIDRCEITTCGGATDSGALVCTGTGAPTFITYCNVHDNTTTGILISASTCVVIGCLITNNTGGSSKGIYDTYGNVLIHNTIYGNGSDGIYFSQGYASIMTVIRNNLITNNGGYGLNVAAAFINGPYAIPGVNYNAFKSNTSGAYHNISAGTGDVTLTADPYTNAGSGDFSLNSTAGGGAACRAAGFPGVFPGATTTGYIDIGAAQHQDSGGGGTTIITRSRGNLTTMGR